MYVDNFPGGIAIQTQPVDRNDDFITVQKDGKYVVYKPMQKLYFDKRVQQPDTDVIFYRVQGTTNWVFDKQKEEVRYALG
jgi:hypothetical protein